MRVRCVENNIFEIKTKGVTDRLKKYIHLSDGQLNLELNTDYVVYGVLFRDNSPWYYLCLDEDDECPSPFPSEMFDVLDSKVSGYWKLSSLIEGDGSVLSLLVFEEWGQDPMFYERLVDDDPKAIDIFRKYRNLIDQEY